MRTTFRTALDGRLAVLVLVTSLAACAAPPTSQNAAATNAEASVRQQLSKDMSACRGRTGYDPASAAAYPNKLAPNELQWRHCMYDALSAYAKASPAVAPQIQALIDGDIAMTTAVNQGTMTRDARKARLQQLIADVEAAEARAASDQQQQSDEFRNNITAIRALGR